MERGLVWAQHSKARLGCLLLRRWWEKDEPDPTPRQHQQWPLSPPTLPRQQVASEATDSDLEETGLEPGEEALHTHTHRRRVGKYSEKRL